MPTQHILAAAAAETQPWTAHDTRLMVAAAVGIATIVPLIVLAKVHPFSWRWYSARPSSA